MTHQIVRTEEDLDTQLRTLRNLEAEALRNYEAIREERAHVEQKLLESQAEVIQYGDSEPDKPAGGKKYRAANGYTFYRTLLDGWRWEGECYHGHPWDRLPEGLFPMTQLVGTQLVKPWHQRKGTT